ncbi:hypothetical protein [Halorussus halophilus]|uniref:hypothetical protein n=1 Tax=Halorussus halophilus TaxID=2650975 RepID=UPI001788211A|nr:hypothetical protein [Halorussus halophilus]
MPGSLSTAARENDLWKSLGLLALLVWVFAVFGDASVASFAPLVVITGGFAIAKTVTDAYDLPESLALTPLGFALAGGAATGVLVEGNRPWLSALLGVAGLWVVFDAIQQARHGDSGTSQTEAYLDGDDRSETMLRFQLLNRVVQAVHAEPRTRAELADDLDLTESRIEQTLSVLAERGYVYRDGDVYRARDEKFGKFAPLVRFVRWLPRRLVRPFRY